MMKKKTILDARTGMRAGIIAALALLMLPLAAWADDALFVYTEGEVDVDHGYGKREMAIIGDPIRTGESVITGATGFAELERGSSTSITVQPDTIFTLEQTASEGEEREVMRCTLGSVAYRFQMIRGKEPYLVTPSAAAGVRGTEVTVTAADDGSSLFVVQSGSVEVEAQGSTVTLEADEGVEVRPGEAPGEKFEVKRGGIDYSQWREARRKAFIEDPVAAALALERRFNSLVAKVEELTPIYVESKRWLEYELEQMKEVEIEKGVEARKEYYREKVFPLRIENHNAFVTLRYWASSALSLRRYVLGRMYMSLKSSYISDLDDPNFQEFLDVYRRILDVYEKKVVPPLTDADLI